MAEDSPRPSGFFSSFWHGTVDKVSSKTLKFMPNVTKSNNGEESEQAEADTDTSNMTRKQKRRLQVRKAQIEHRQRKQNYIKHLEQDVSDLREMISLAETQSALFKHENQAIRATLNKCNIPISLNALSISNQPPSHPGDNASPSMSNQIGFQNNIATMSSLEENSDWHSHSLSPSETSLVSVNFDQFLDAMCLQISPTQTPSLDDNINTNAATASDLALLNNGDLSIPAAILNSPETTQPQTIAPTVQPPDLTTLAINFILALEHPCRTHFHPPTTAGHTLMASSLIYSTAPPPVFASFASPPPPPFSSQSPPSSSTPPTSPSWNTPTPTLQSLLALSNSLPKSDWEITPVQAWFRLVERVGVERLLADGGRILEVLKSKVGELVKCYHFGAVMSELLFWREVEAVLNDDSTGKEQGLE